MKTSSNDLFKFNFVIGRPSIRIRRSLPGSTPRPNVFYSRVFERPLMQDIHLPGSFRSGKKDSDVSVFTPFVFLPSLFHTVHIAHNDISNDRKKLFSLDFYFRRDILDHPN